MSLTNKINNLIASSNNATGASDTTLTNAVTRLISGYGDNDDGGIIKEMIIPQQTLNTSIKTTNGYGAFFTNYVRYPVEGEQYLVTFDDVEYIAKAENYSADNALCIGDINVIYASSDSRLVFPFVVVLTTSNTFFLSTRTNANHTIKVEKIELIEDLELIEKNITSNGIYTASNDNVNGYSSITVNVVNQDYEDALVALGTQSDLTDGIEALTAYSNNVTGESDTTLSDAVHTLADGYGQGGDTFEGLRLVSVDSNTGRPISYKWEGNTIPAYGLKYCYYGTGNGQRCTIDLSNVEYIKQYALDCSGLEPINTLNIKEMDSYALSLRQGINVNDLRSKTLNLENYTGYGIGKNTNVNSVFRSGDTTNYFGTTLCPKIEHVPMYAFCNVKSDIIVQFGSIGYPVRTVGQRPFLNATGTNTITVYTTGSLLDTVKTAVENSAGTNTTFIYKASEATTYNSTEYAAGDTMLTSTP